MWGGGALNIEAETKWLPIRRRYFKCIFLDENARISINIWLKFIPNIPIGNILASDNGLVPNRRQAIIWTIGGLVYSRIHASLLSLKRRPLWTKLRYIVHNKSKGPTVYATVTPKRVALMCVQRVVKFCHTSSHAQYGRRSILSRFANVVHVW